MLSPGLMLPHRKQTAIDVHARPRLEFGWDHWQLSMCLHKFLLDGFTDGTIHSMTCEKQFVPRDEKAIYCSEG